MYSVRLADNETIFISLEDWRLNARLDALSSALLRYKHFLWWQCGIKGN